MIANVLTVTMIANILTVTMIAACSLPRSYAYCTTLQELFVDRVDSAEPEPPMAARNGSNLNPQPKAQPLLLSLDLC